MQLKPWYRYVGLDFETTGLDPSKDEAIQIALVEIDCTWNVIKEFSSLCKPEWDIKKIKDIITFITWLKIEDLEQAPAFAALEQEIRWFFDEKTIIIGHNVSFDVNFLKKYLPDIPYYQSIDTYTLSQTLVHYAPSHALEILVSHLQSEALFARAFTRIHAGLRLDQLKHHDALVDTKNALALFWYAVEDISRIGVAYPVLRYFVDKTLWIFHDIFEYDTSQLAYIATQKIVLPALQKIAPSNTSINPARPLDIHTFQKNERYFVGNVDFKTLLSSLAVNKQVIFAFSSNNKLDIAKAIFYDMGMKNIGYAREDQVINTERFQKFLQKNSFIEWELLFIIKYLSHLDAGYGVLDLNGKIDSQIFYAIKETKQAVKYPIVLTTHAGLFSLLDDEQSAYHNYDICFFDVEYRYKSYNMYLSRPCDVYYTLNFLDMLLYTYRLDSSNETIIQTLEQFHSFWETFMGVLFIETKKLFIRVQDNYIQINPIVGNGDFYQTNALLSQFLAYREKLKTLLKEKDFVPLWRQIQHLLDVFNGLVTVSKKMYTASDFYFLYGETNRYTNRLEFTEKCNHVHALFLSNFERAYPRLIDDTRQPSLPYKKITELDKILPAIEECFLWWDQIVYVFSAQKDQSKLLFDSLYTLERMKDVTLLVENLTGGSGKNIFKAQSPGKKLIIWGYNFLLNLFSYKVSIDILLLFHIKGSQEHYLLYDILWYAPQKHP